MNINDSITTLSGIGEKRAQQFEKENITKISDLLNFSPIRYEDRTIIGNLNNIDSEITTKLKVLNKGKTRFIRKNYNIFILPVVDENNIKGEVVFFNQPYLINKFKKDEEYFFFGKIVKRKNTPQIFSPKFALSSNRDFLSIKPIYKKIEKIPNTLVPKLISEVLNNIKIKDYIPEKYLNKYNLLDLKETYRSLHFPKNQHEIKEAVRRIKFNEGLKINTGIFSKEVNKQVTDLVITNFQIIEPFIKKLPFKLTDAQQNVLREIFRDLENGFLMNRLLQGDVGSGKTIIAVICSYLFYFNGLQVAYMAPTEILAKQHYESFKEYFKDYNINIKLLVGSINNKEAQKIRDEIKSGKVDIVIGTHALFQDSTDFYNLGLVITDEQHRFGVKQRGQLENKGKAHTLVMTATPIPRTLALTLYGDLDLSIIDQLPQGRKKVKTSFHTLKKLNKIMEFTVKEIEEGHQAFIVCPYIEESNENNEVISVEKAYKNISKKYGKKIRIEKLHSHLTTDEKEEIINHFNNGEIDLLIATSIIEVGINVPNVSVIIILSADRFGLSQLHQLRGRTGRSNLQSYCFLVSNNKSEETIERMRTIVNCHDGQKIAEVDLKMRGPGEYFGYHQHGFTGLQYINPVIDEKLFIQTKEVALEIYNSTSADDMICKDYLIKEFNQNLEYITLD